MAPSRALRQAFRLDLTTRPSYYNILRPLRPTPAHLTRPINPPSYLHGTRSFSAEASVTDPEPPDYLSESELKIFNKLKHELNPTKLEVQDISGGCGSMYGIEIISPKFAGIPVIKQHRLVNQVLGDEIKSWHGIQLKTRAA